MPCKIVKEISVIAESVANGIQRAAGAIVVKRDGGAPIFVPADVTELEINEPVSVLTNLNDAIRSLPNLEKLTFYASDYGKTDATQSLAFLRGASQLKELSLCSMPHLRDCAPLLECKKLEALRLTRQVTKVFDFRVLPSLSTSRSLSGEMPSNAVLTRISKVSQLTALEALGGFKLAFLEPLAGLANLRQLKLWSGSLASSRGLLAFSELEVLNLGYSKIRDTAELGSLTKLKKLELLGNKYPSGGLRLGKRREC